MSSEFRAPTRLKSKIFSALVQRQRQEGPLLSLTRVKEDGRKLCIFEELVQIAPLGERAKQPNFCRICHARVLAERIENAPVYWPGCPYADFQKS
jgi:hypothetical protein